MLAFQSLHLSHPTTASQENIPHCPSDHGRRRKPLEMHKEEIPRDSQAGDPQRCTCTRTPTPAGKDTRGGPSAFARLSQHPTPRRKPKQPAAAQPGDPTPPLLAQGTGTHVRTRRHRARGGNHVAEITQAHKQKSTSH